MYAEYRNIDRKGLSRSYKEEKCECLLCARIKVERKRRWGLYNYTHKKNEYKELCKNDTYINEEIKGKVNSCGESDVRR